MQQDSGCRSSTNKFGIISGGGSKPRGGKMGTSIKESISGEAIANAEKELSQLVEQLDSLRRRIGDAKRCYQAAKKAEAHLEIELYQKAIDSLNAQHNASRPKKDELERLKELDSIIHTEEKELEKLSKCSAKIKDRKRKMSTLLSKLNSSLSLTRWIRIFRHHKIQSDNNKDDNDNNNGNDSNGDSNPMIPTPPAVECYACTQAGVPAFHSTTCDRTNAPEWEASVGSSLIPIRNNPPKTLTSRRGSLNLYTQWIFGRVLDPRSKQVQRWNWAILLARAVALVVDPLFFYSLSIGREGAPCLYIDGGLAVIVTVLRTYADIVHVIHVWLQFRVAYVLMESLVVGCGKLVWDVRMIAEHYVRSVKGFWFDVFIILPVPQDASDLGGDDADNDDEGKDDEKIVWVDEVLKSEAPIYDGPQNGLSHLCEITDGGFVIWAIKRIRYM